MVTLMSLDSRPMSPFKMIYKAACTKDTTMLEEALKLASINVRHIYTEGPPIRYLAEDGNVEAVNFLLDHGASPEYAACGYAECEDESMEKLDALLERVKAENPEQIRACLQKAALGFGIKGYSDDDNEYHGTFYAFGALNGKIKWKFVANEEF